MADHGMHRTTSMNAHPPSHPVIHNHSVYVALAAGLGIADSYVGKHMHTQAYVYACASFVCGRHSCPNNLPLLSQQPATPAYTQRPHHRSRPLQSRLVTGGSTACCLHVVGAAACPTLQALRPQAPGWQPPSIAGAQLLWACRAQWEATTCADTQPPAETPGAMTQPRRTLVGACSVGPQPQTATGWP
jgi:hypothetical protein